MNNQSISTHNNIPTPATRGLSPARSQPLPTGVLSRQDIRRIVAELLG